MVKYLEGEMIDNKYNNTEVASLGGLAPCKGPTLGKALNKVLQSFAFLLFGFAFSLVFAGNVQAACPTNPDTATNTGTFSSQVIDNTTSKAYTTADFTVTTPTSTCVMLKVRSGNTATPDGTWQAWSGLLATGASISSYSGRYVQYQAVLGSDDINNVPNIGVVTINYVTYNSPATLGGATAGNVGLRADTISAGKAKILDWNGTTDTAGQKLLFKVRAGDDQTELDASSCYGPSAADVGCADWSTAGKFFSQEYNGADPPNPTKSGTSVFSSILLKRYIEVLVRMESSGTNTPVLDNVTLTYDTVDTPTDLKSHRADNDSLISTWTNGNVVAKADIRGANNGDTLTAQFDVVTEIVDFDGTPSTPAGVTAIANDIEYTGDGETWMQDQNLGTISGLVVDTYYYKVRITDQAGRVSGWNDTYETISVDQTPPTGSVSIDEGDHTDSTSVNLTLSAADTDSGLSQMRISNDGIFDTEEWETYATSKAWTLAEGDGEKTIYGQYRDNAGNVSGTWTQTTTAEFDEGIEGTDVEILSDSFYLLKPNGATASDPSECASNYIDGGVCAVNPWFPGRAGTAMEGKGVYYINEPTTLQWKKTDTSCVDPQCQTDLDPNYPANYALVSPQTYPSEPFTDYTAQIACKAKGGHLPYTDELLELYAGQASYGNNFGGGVFWSGTEYNATYPWHVGFTAGNLDWGYPKSSNRGVRCIKDDSTSGNGGSGPAGTFESVAKDNTIVQNYGNVSWSADVPVETGSDALRFQVASNNDNATWNYIGPDGTAATYYTSSGTQLHSSHDGDRYIRYKAYLQTANNQYKPTVYDVTIEYPAQDSITLDTNTPTIATYSIESSTGDTTYAADASRVVKAKGIFDDTDRPSDLKVQFSEDGTNWGKYGSGTTNLKTTDWTNYVTVTPTATLQTLTNAWYLEGTDGEKTLYVRAQDGAGNVVGEVDIYADDYIDGRVGTAMEGKEVYYQNSSQAQWKTSRTSCVGPQCATGLDPNYSANYALVASNTVDFSLYPARNTCKAIGGRLPYMDELSELYAGQASYGNNFGTGYFWSATEASTTLARRVTFSAGDPYYAKIGSSYVRCVRDTDNLPIPIFSSLILDTSPPSEVQNLSASQNNETSIIVSWSEYSDNGAPITNYQLNRVKKNEYESNGLTATGNWSGVSSYSVIDCGTQIFFTENLTGITTEGCTITSGENIITSVAYYYRVRAKDDAYPAEWGVWNGEAVKGLTIDGVNPTVPTSITASACQEGGTNCSNVANAGYEVKLTWATSSDAGSGVTGYKVYRKHTTYSSTEENYTLVGYVDIDPPKNQVVAPENPVVTYYDNDTNNDATFTDATIGDIKTETSNRLNDYVNYYYRITALDENLNETNVIAAEPGNPLNLAYNSVTSRTVDVTNPSVPSSLTATAVGIDSLGGDPLTQRMDISWGNSLDKNNQTRTPTGNGSGIKEYVLYQAQGDIVGPTEAYTQIYAGSTNSHTEEGLLEDTYYYYKVKAVDNVDNESAESASRNTQTKNSQVPTSATNVTVTAKTGDPNTDSEVGSVITISFNGSRITGTDNEVDGYKVYRSTTNLTSEAEWLALTPVKIYADLNIPTDTQDGVREFTDTVPDDSTTYYYKVMAEGWNESNQEIVYSSLSAIAPDSLHLGWDTTPDATAPTSPLEVTVKDIHGDGTSMLRNIITWLRLDTSLADNERNETVDFAEYRVYRYTPTTIDSPELVASHSDLSDNYYVDGIPLAEANDDYYYYVVTVDNADTEYKYSSPNDTTVVNSIANVSDHLDPVSINPSIAKPTVSNVVSTNVGVSSVTVTWATDQNCDSVVEYRVKDSSEVLTSGRNRQTPTDTHSVTVRSLSKNTIYEYRAISENSLGNTDEIQSTTWPKSQKFITQDFSISNIKVEITTTTATVSWSTNIGSDSSVEYKPELSTKDSQTAGDPVLSTSHSVLIKSLKPATTYTYKIRSVSADGYITDTQFATFSTKPYDASQFIMNPNASNVAEQNITATSAKIVWETAIATTTWVDYGTESKDYNQSAGNDDLNTIHVVELKNLTPGTTYYYRVRGEDVNSIEYTSKEYSFIAVLQPEVSAIKVSLVDPYTVRVSFNTNVDTEASVTYGKDGNLDFKAGHTDFIRNHIIELENLEDSSTYNYYIEIKDRLDNSAKSASGNFQTPLDTTGAEVANLKIDILPMGESDETASIIVSWNTNKPTTTKVEYDEGVIGVKFSQSTIEDESLNTSHTVIIKELLPSTTYKFRIAGSDKRDNKTESQDYTFVTPEKEKSIWQLIVRSIEKTFSWVSNVGSLFRR